MADVSIADRHDITLGGVKLPKYEKLRNYDTFFPMNVKRIFNLLNGA